MNTENDMVSDLMVRNAELLQIVREDAELLIQAGIRIDQLEEENEKLRGLDPGTGGIPEHGAGV